MKAEDSQETVSRELQPKKVEREPWTVLTTDNVSRAPTQKSPGQASVQMLEFRWKSPIQSHFFGPSACLPGGDAHSACRCSNRR